MKVAEIRKAGSSSKIKAYFNVITEDNITIKGFKLADGSKGLFVAMPSEQDHKDKKKYWDRVVMSKDMRDELLRLVLPEYEKLGSGDTDDQEVQPDNGIAPF
jgi:DNA-binding cell septation regulator SpoVG